LHKQIFFIKPSKGKIETKMYSSGNIDDYTQCKEYLLFLHAITECDTGSAFFNKRKIITLKLLRQDLQSLTELFNQKNCPPNVIVDNEV